MKKQKGFKTSPYFWGLILVPVALGVYDFASRLHFRLLPGAAEWHAKSWLAAGGAALVFAAVIAWIDRYEREPWKWLLLDSDYAWPYNNQGVVLAKMDRLDEALERFSRAIALFSDPQDQAVAYSNRCNAYRLMGDFDRALADCERATQLDPTNVSAYDRRVLIYRESEDYDKAMDDLSVAIELEPTAGRYEKRAWVYSETGNYQAAITDYETAIKLAPGDAAAYNSLAWLYADTLETNLERALELAQRAVELQPENPHYLDTLAWTYYKLGQSQEALDIYDKTIDRVPEKEPYLYRGRGYVRAETGQVADAIADLEMYLQLAPDADDRGEVEALINELRGE